MKHEQNYAVLALLSLGVVAGVLVPWPAKKATPPRVEPIEAPVPMLESTPTADAGPVLWAATSATIPKPGPNQLRAGKCDPEQEQVEINGGCWVQTTRRPPCPRGKQWEHEGRCYLPVAEAKPVPTTGGGHAPGVANP